MMAKKDFYPEGCFVAIRSIEEQFYIAQCKEFIPKDSISGRRYKVRWLDKIGLDKHGSKYVLSFDDNIYPRSILCIINIEKQTRLNFHLKSCEEKKILLVIESFQKKQQSRKKRGSDILKDITLSESKSMDNKKNVIANFHNESSTESANLSLLTSLEISKSTENFVIEAGSFFDSFNSLVDPKEIIPAPEVNITNSTDLNESLKNTELLPLSPNLINVLQFETNKSENSTNVSTAENTDGNIFKICSTYENLKEQGLGDCENLTTSTLSDNIHFIESPSELKQPTANFKTITIGSVGSISRQMLCSTPIENTANNLPTLTESTGISELSPQHSKSVIEPSIESKSKASTNENSTRSDILKTSISSHSNFTESAISSSEISTPELKGKQDVNCESSYEEPTKDALFVQAARKTSTGIRVYDKQHVCYYCYKSLSKMTRHLMTVHKSNTEVARLLAMDPKSEERTEGFMCLLRAGDYYHNCEVLSTKSGELILSRRPTKNELKLVTISDYGPCPKCLGFMLLDNMWHHVKYKCPKNDQQRDSNSEQNSVRRFDIRGESTALLCNVSHVPSEFAEDILAKLKNDEISYVCKNDELIIGLGLLMFEKFGKHQHDHIRQTMRQLARLVLQTKTLNAECADIWACVKPTNFDSVIKAVKQLCQSLRDPSDREQHYGIPSLALKLGHNLKKCALIGRGIALRKGLLDTDRQITSFLDIMGIEWSMRISSAALRTLRSNKLNTTELLPITEDLISLNRFLDETISSIITLSQNDDQFFVDNYFRLSRAVLCRIILFNKRRSGEVSKMKISQYASRPDNNPNTVLGESLTPLEKEMCRRLVLVEVTGKSRALFKVPILLTLQLKAAVDKLIEYRHLIPDIASENQYVFPKGSNSLNYLRGHDCLRYFCSEIDLQSPQLITGTKLRKYIATAVQIFDLKEHEYDWLARHLGHDIRVHRNFYRLHESTVELTKISRLLLAVDSGEAHKFKGESLENINAMELPDLELEDAGQESNSDDSDYEIEASVKKHKKCEDAKKTKNKSSKANTSSNDKKKIEKTKVSRQPSKKAAVTKRPWSSSEAEVVLQFFRENIKKKKVPGKKQCDSCIEEKKNILGKRKWTDVKFYVKNHISKLKKHQD